MFDLNKSLTGLLLNGGCGEKGMARIETQMLKRVMKFT
jgi:hypothetical protein